jgi:hypothetical protein
LSIAGTTRTSRRIISRASARWCTDDHIATLAILQLLCFCYLQFPATNK